jgi:hypothetical protein
LSRLAGEPLDALKSDKTRVDLTLSHELCIGQTCVTEDRLKAMIAAAAAGASGSGSDDADLGATITGPTADLNLGLTTLLDGATTAPLMLSTATSGQHTNEHRAFD